MYEQRCTNILPSARQYPVEEKAEQKDEPVGISFGPKKLKDKVAAQKVFTRLIAEAERKNKIKKERAEQLLRPSIKSPKNKSVPKIKSVGDITSQETKSQGRPKPKKSTSPSKTK